MIAAEMSEYHYLYEDVGDGRMPIISLEIMSDSSNNEVVESDFTIENTAVESSMKDMTTGVHFLTEQSPDNIEPRFENGNNEVVIKGRSDLLEYMTRNDGSVICKLCGEILQSRTHWYRHKYKVHMIQPLNPAPLFQCEQCHVYFKSRKGYIGHIASKHADVLSDASPILSNSQIEGNLKVKIPIPQEIKEAPDPELVIPTSSVPNYQTASTKPVTKSTEAKKTYRAKEPVPTRLPGPIDWEERRSRENKMVIDIIDRVRRECEAQQGAGIGGGPARRGYSRKTTIMHT
ncbi:unnamed protein product [Arctia plantaginis]|uniref:C2H2-type domain-containing protein n=1 Tax=Arctia plantaginis TaxID=874455 RepID=A0A8S0ZE81_ARCPL|nr:unnamed protein product [Arctia plantaginis]